MLELLADLTRRIPDDTSLEKIAVNGGNIVLIGQSAQASALVGAAAGFAADPHADADRLGADAIRAPARNASPSPPWSPAAPRKGGRQWRRVADR